MAQQLKKKFIGNDQVDGSKILLEQSQTIRAKDSSNQEVDLISLGVSDEVLVKGQEIGLKSDIDAEQARAEAAEGVLQGNIDSEEASRIAGDQALQGEIDAAEGRLDTAEGEIDTLQSEMDAVEGRLDIIEGPDSQVGSISKALKDAKDYTDAEIAALVDSAPEILDTLSELATALGEDPNFATTVTNQIAGVQSAVDAVEDDVSKLVTLSGAGPDAINLGLFDGNILVDNEETVKSAIQKLSNEIESIGGGGSSTQTELDNTQQGAGLNTDGSYIAPINSNYLNGTLSLAGADMMLDTQIKVNEDAIAQEVIDREADVDAEEARAIAAEGVLQSNIADVASDLALHISQEIGAHEASAISVSPIADVTGDNVQSVAEDLKSQIDTVASNLAQEVIDREADVDAEETRALTAEGVLQSNINTVSSNLAQEILDREADVDAEETRALAAEAALQGEINAVEVDVADHESRISTLEGALTPTWERVKFDLTSTDISNGYVDLSHEAIANSISAFVDRLAIHEGEDFTVSVEGGVTRITFSGDLVPPSGQSQLDDSDNIYVRYQRLA